MKCGPGISLRISAKYSNTILTEYEGEGYEAVVGWRKSKKLGFRVSYHGPRETH